MAVVNSFRSKRK